MDFKLRIAAQELTLLQNTFTNVIKSIGDALSGMARK
jgi:hypothetical protein